MSESVIQDEGLKPLLDKMVAAKQLSAIDARHLAQQQAGQGNGSALTEEEILRWLAGEYGLAYTDLSDIEPDRQLLSLFPARILLKEELLPLRRLNGTVEVATSRLFATQGLDALKTLTGLHLRPVLASSEAIQREMKKRLGVGADTLGTLGEEANFQVVEEHPSEDTNLDEAAEDASIIRFVNQVLRDAIELRASDIHLEPFEDELRIRYRIDGVLQDVPVPAQIKRFQPAIVSRVKILSHLNIAEKRLPQDGRIKILIDESEGEIRDQETAQIAVQASLTGHLVFSTLHTNDAPGALTRLVDMGVEPYLVASSLEAVLAQRLVRVLCNACKEEDHSPAAEAFKAQVGIPAKTTIYHSVGCRECRQTGFHGRHAIFEWMDSDNEIRQLVLKNASSDVIRDAARRAGMKTLAEDGWRLVALGVTTVEEVLSVTTAKEVARSSKAAVAEMAKSK